MPDIDKQNQKIKTLIRRHEDWKSMWTKRTMLFSVEMVSPRGKAMTCSAYQYEVNKHLDATVEKIRKVLL